MSSGAKKAANRANAKRSTGPKTAAGKKASARNATRHAILSVVPVLPEIERLQDWEAHRAATIASLAPVGYLETTLADRVASLLWRLGRVTRYETTTTGTKIEAAEADLASMLPERRLLRLLPLGVTGTTPRQIQDDIEFHQTTELAFAALRRDGPEAPFAPEEAVLVLSAVARLVGVKFADLPLPPLPASGVGWQPWDGWTKGKVLEAVSVAVAASKDDACRLGGTEAAIRECVTCARSDVITATDALRKAEAELRQWVHARMLLSGDSLENLTRYEAHLERSMYRALHEIERLQAARLGAGVSSMALAAGTTTGPRVAGPEST